MVAAGKLPTRPGIRRIIEGAQEAGWALAVASTSAEPSVRAILEQAIGPQRAARFDLVLAGDVVQHKKPAPDIYLMALERLGVAPPEALVVEDSRNGLLAATGAGLRTVMTVNGYTEEEDSTRSDPGRPVAWRSRTASGRGSSRTARSAQPGDYITLADLSGAWPPDAAIHHGHGTTRRSVWQIKRLDDVDLVLKTMATTIVENAEYFAQLDSIVGDGDFGFSLRNGFEVVVSDYDTFDRPASARS